MRKFVLPFLVAALLVKVVEADVWDVATYEASPAHGDYVSEADDRMRDMKFENRSRLEVEHWVGATGAADDNGLHRLGSARAFMASAAPTVLADGQADYDNAGEVPAVTELDDAATNSGATARDDVGDGRLWNDLDGPAAGTDDDNKLYVFVGAVGDAAGAFAEAKAQHDAPIEFADDVLAGAYNLVYNGSFEATHGTGVGSTTVPLGWTATNATIAYSSKTDTTWGDGLEVNVTASAGNGRIEQALNGLNSDSFYKVNVRARDNGATVCTLDINGEGGTAFVADSTAGTGAWETLTGTFGTAAAVLDDVDVYLITVTNGQECDWDDVSIYPIGDVTTDREADPAEISMPSTVALYDFDNTDAVIPNSFTTVPNIALEFTPPGPGWTIQVGYSISVEGAITSARYRVQCRLDEDGSDVASTLRQVGVDSDNGTVPAATLSAVYLSRNPAPGTALTYTVECTDFNYLDEAEYNSDDLGLGTDPYSNLWLIAHAPR